MLFSVGLLLLCSCESRFIQKYEAAEDMYYGDDVNGAIEELKGFESFLESIIERSFEETPANILRSLFLTRVRLYGVYTVLGDEQKISAYYERIVEIDAKLNEINPVPKKVLKESLNELLYVMQEGGGPSVPLWRLKYPRLEGLR